jgi:hypothetical protein
MQNALDLAISSFDAADLESSASEEVVDAAIEVAAAGDALPHRIEPVLPPRDGDVRRVPMLDEEQTASKPQHAADFPQARPVSGMEHAVQVMTTSSMLASASGMTSAEAGTNSNGTRAASIRRASRQSSLGGSSPYSLWTAGL